MELRLLLDLQGIVVIPEIWICPLMGRIWHGLQCKLAADVFREKPLWEKIRHRFD